MLECPPKLRSLTAANMNPYLLYSYWVSIYVLLYLALVTLVPKKYIPTWISPYPSVIIATLIQLGLFIVSAKYMPLYFIVGVGLWKFILLLITIVITDPDWSVNIILFNVAILVIYWLYCKYYDISPLEIYKCIESNPMYYPASLTDFFNIRIKSF